MKWIKVDHFTGKPITTKGWHICDYISGDYKIIVNDNGKWTLTYKGNEVETFKTLKAAKLAIDKEEV